MLKVCSQQIFHIFYDIYLGAVTNKNPMSITSLYFKAYSSGTPSGWSNTCPDMQMCGKYLCNVYGGMYLSHDYAAIYWLASSYSSTDPRTVDLVTTLFMDQFEPFSKIVQ